jgi:hypothetical protein
MERDLRAEIMARLAKAPADWGISTPTPLSPETEAFLRRLREEELRRVHASIAKQTTKAGIEVARYEIEPDGKIIVVTGKPIDQTNNDADPWERAMQGPQQ